MRYDEAVKAVLTAAMAVLAIGSVACLVRAVIGPTHADRLIAARDQGVTAAQLVTASEQKISDGEIYAIINAGKADMETYRRLEAALEVLGR